MCRLLGAISSLAIEYGPLLRSRVRSLGTLSRQHPDGWGLAAYAARDWRVHKGILAAWDDPSFHRFAEELSGEMLIAHVRKRTVGDTRSENTHPFRQSGWVFAHNGTIKERERLTSRISARRRAEIAGDTDSEIFFAHLLTRLDDAGLTHRPATAETDQVIRELTASCRTRTEFGSFNFLLSNGGSMYVHRFGRSLYLLDRAQEESADPRDSGVYQRRRAALFIASEPVTDEAWREVPDGTLLRIDRGASVSVTDLNARPAAQAAG